MRLKYEELGSSCLFHISLLIKRIQEQLKKRDKELRTDIIIPTSFHLFF